MSWGYWGIVAGVLVLLITFFVCVEILYHDARKASDDETRTPATSSGGDMSSGTKRAA